MEHFLKQLGHTNKNDRDNDNTSNNNNKIAIDEHTPIQNTGDGSSSAACNEHQQGNDHVSELENTSHNHIFRSKATKTD